MIYSDTSYSNSLVEKKNNTSMIVIYGIILLIVIFFIYFMINNYSYEDKDTKYYQQKNKPDVDEIVRWK